MTEDTIKFQCDLPDLFADQCGSCSRHLCSCPPYSRVSFSILANEQAFCAGWALLVTSILASSYSQTANTNLYIIGQYIKYVNIPLSLFILFLEYPRGKKKAGENIDERPLQKYIAPIHYFFRWPTKYFLPRSIFYLLASGITQFNLATSMAGICLFISSIFYFIAAVYGEKWIPPKLAYGRDSKCKESTLFTAGTNINHPNEPPPRGPPKNT